MPARADRAPLSPELRVAYMAAAVAPDLTSLRTLMHEPLDWGRVLLLAEREKATPVLARVVAMAGADLVPAAPLEHLRRSGMVQDFQMIRLASRLQHTLSVFRARGVPVLLLKGAALASSVHAGGFTDRPMTDADLLVRPADLERARQAVIDSGWPETRDPIQRALLRDQHHLPHFVDPEPTGLRIELHSMILPPEHPFALAPDAAWEEARPAHAPFDAALIASPEFLLLHACLHFAWSHTMLFGAWRTFRDVSALTRLPDFDWDRFVARAQAAKGATACYWTLRLAARMSAVPVPPAVLAALAPPTTERVRRMLERHFVAMLAPGEAPPCPSTRLAHTLWRAALRPRWSGHARAGRFDAEHRWEHARGIASTETITRRVARHAGGLVHWWDFATRTLASITASRR